MRYKAVIFDLDGTLLSTLADLTGSVNIALEQNGLNAVTEENVRSFIGNGSLKLIERAILYTGGDISDVDKVHGDYKKAYLEHCLDNTVPYPGIPELLKFLRDGGIKVAVNTNKPHDPALKVLDHCLPGLIDTVAAQSSTIPRKPDPTGVFTIIDRLGLNISECCYVGDSDVDIKTARNAGIDIFSVDWGFREHLFLENSGADVICSDADDLRAALVV